MAAAAVMLPGAPKVSITDYQGMGPTIVKVAQYVRSHGDDPAFQAFANAILDECYPRSRHTTTLERAQCLLDYMNKNVRFTPDPPGTELVKSPKIVLCVPGGLACVPLEDCEGHAAAYLALCRAVGIDVWILLQKLEKMVDASADAPHEFHMAGIVRLDDGSRVRVDPSLKGNSKVGEFQAAIDEQIIDPLDPDVTGSVGGAKLVTIGAAPRPTVYFIPTPGLRRMPAPMIAGCTPCAMAAAAKKKREEEETRKKKTIGSCCSACAGGHGTCEAKKKVEPGVLRAMASWEGNVVTAKRPVYAPQLSAQPRRPIPTPQPTGSTIADSLANAQASASAGDYATAIRYTLYAAQVTLTLEQQLRYQPSIGTIRQANSTIAQIANSQVGYGSDVTGAFSAALAWAQAAQAAYLSDAQNQAPRMSPGGVSRFLRAAAR